MIASITVKPISENRIIVVTSGGIAIEIQDGSSTGVDMFIAAKADDLRFAKAKIIKIMPPRPENGIEGIQVEVKPGFRS
jgi:hypothetical protein